MSEQAFSVAELGLRVLVVAIDGIEVSETLSLFRMVETTVETATEMPLSPFLFT